MKAVIIQSCNIYTQSHTHTKDSLGVKVRMNMILNSCCSLITFRQTHCKAPSHKDT